MYFLNVTRKKFSPIRKNKNPKGRQKKKKQKKNIGKLEGKVGLGGLMKVEIRERSSQGKEQREEGKKWEGKKEGEREDSSKTRSFRSAMSNVQRTEG